MQVLLLFLLSLDGKPSWKVGEKVVWFNEDRNFWIIGMNSTSDIGYSFFAENKNENEWNYWDGKDWKKSRPSDIDIQCWKDKSMIFSK